jgi:hypothetical protein
MFMGAALPPTNSYSRMWNKKRERAERENDLVVPHSTIFFFSVDN